jgi:tripartite-type tricarboxylate transporter receptor subunit TctC
MKLPNAIAVAIVLAVAVPAFAAETKYPVKSLRFVVPFAPGGGADLMARLAGAKVGELLGQQVVIDNRAGAGGNIAAEVVAKSAPDGYTLLQGSVAHAISTSLYRKLNYDLARDFIPVTQLAATPFILAVNPAVPATSVRELIAYAKAQPGRLAYGSSGNGGPSHLGTELFKARAGIDMRHVPYKGGVPAGIDLMAGQIQVMFNTPPVILPHSRTGRMRALGVANLKRIPAAPELPTVAEAADLPGFEIATWYGVMVPAGAPANVVTTLHAAFTTALRAPEVRDRLAAENLDVVGSTPAEFAAYVKAEVPKWAKVVKASGARVD